MAIAEAAAPALLERAHSWVANREVEGRAGRRAAINPATGRPFAETTLLDAEQVGQAVDAAPNENMKRAIQRMAEKFGPAEKTDKDK